MNKKLENLFKFLIRNTSYLFFFLLPWQTKLIVRSAGNNFNEISFFSSHIILLFLLLIFLIYRCLNTEVKDRANLLWYPLAGISFFAFISFFVAPDKVLAFYKYIVLMLGLGLFFFLQESFRVQAYKESLLNKNKIILTFLSSIFAHVLLGIYQFLSQSSFAFKYLGLAYHSPEIAGSSVIETVSGRWLRAYGGFDHPNIFAGVLVVSIIVATYYLAKKKLIRTSAEIFESLFLFVFFFFSLLALLFTFSRSAWAALVLGIFSLFVYFLIKKEKWELGRLLALLFFSLILVSSIFFSYKEIFDTRIDASSRLEKISITERREQFVETGNILKDKWFFGVGLGNYSSFLESQDLKEKKELRESWQYQPVHNSFLLLWSETGLFSLIFLLSFFVIILKKKKQEALAWSILLPLIFLMFFDHWLLSLPFGIIFFFFVFGII